MHENVVVPCTFIKNNELPLYVLYVLFFQLNHQIETTGEIVHWFEQNFFFLLDYNCIIILCQLILELIRCPCSYCPGTAVMCRFSAACTCCSASPWPHPKIFKCGEAIHANVATAHFPKTCCSLSNITSNHFPGKTLRIPQPGLCLSDPFSRQPPWSCVTLTGVIVDGGRLSYLEGLSSVGGRGQRLRWTRVWASHPLGHWQ